MTVTKPRVKDYCVLAAGSMMVLCTPEQQERVAECTQTAPGCVMPHVPALKYSALKCTFQ